MVLAARSRMLPSTARHLVLRSSVFGLSGDSDALGAAREPRGLDGACAIGRVLPVPLFVGVLLGPAVGVWLIE